MAKFTKTCIEDWRQLAERELKGRSPDELVRETPEGIAVKPLYTAEDLEGLEHMGTMPGSAPYVRGPRRPCIPAAPGRCANTPDFRRLKIERLLSQEPRGRADGPFPSPSTSPRIAVTIRITNASVGDVGKAGVAIDSVEDMKILFDGIPLDKMSVSMTMNGAVLPVLAMYIVAGEEQGVDHKDLSGTIQNDILKEFMVRNTYIYPPEPSMRIVADIIEYTAKEMPRFNSISISGYHMQEAGATCVQELAYTLADGVEYVRAAISKGLDVDAFAPRLSFFFCLGMDFFMEIAKLRAARFLWAKMMTEKFQPKDPRSSALRTHCQTSGVSLTEHDPYNNVIRTTIEALAGVLGGTQSLHTNAFDEALALPSDFSMRIARNTQLVSRTTKPGSPVADHSGGQLLHRKSDVEFNR